MYDITVKPETHNFVRCQMKLTHHMSDTQMLESTGHRNANSTRRQPRRTIRDGTGVCSKNTNRKIVESCTYMYNIYLLLLDMSKLLIQ